MSYWSHNPELLDELTIGALSPVWKYLVENEHIQLDDVPEKVRDKAMDDGIADYWAGLADQEHDRRKDSM